MQYLSSVYFVNQPLQVSDIFVAHHQKVYCIYTTIGTCCDFQLTVCWTAGRPAGRLACRPSDSELHSRNASMRHRLLMGISRITIQRKSVYYAPTYFL